MGANGFVVVYRWRILPGKEAEFEAAWHRVTVAIRDRCGSYGSRLHRAADGSYLGYARWPSEASWRACFAQGSPDAEGVAAMQRAVESREPEIRLEIRDDLIREP